VSLVSFHKKELIIYITNFNALYTTNTREYDLIAFDMDDWCRNNPPELLDYYSGRTRVIDNIWTYEFSVNCYGSMTKKKLFYDNLDNIMMTSMNNMKCMRFNKSNVTLLFKRHIFF
jgi:hypothetical protein